MICKHCEIEIWSECYTPELGEYDHPGYCCDCFDLSWFHDEPGCLEQLNKERAAKGRPPITKPWLAGGYPRVDFCPVPAYTSPLCPSKKN